MESTGVNEMGELGLNISVNPNPSTSIFQVSTLSGLITLTEFKWEVRNTHGSIVAKGTNENKDITINLSSHTKGIYYLKITQEGLQTVRKLVMQ